VPAPLISDPRPVDPRAPRFAAALTAAVLALALLTASTWLLAAQALVFALGVAQRSPYVLLFRRVVRPRLGPPAELEDPRPLRFAQVVGLLFTAAALTGAVTGLPGLAAGATAAALAAAFLNAAFGICLGCEAYLLFRRSPLGSRSAPDRRTLEPSPTPIRSEVSL
jgi:hypothetical protein